MGELSFVPDDFREMRWNDYTLMYAGLSIGNVGALCLEILIENTRDSATKVAHIEDDAVLPMIGRIKTRNGDTRLCHGLELYELKQSKVVFLLQRSPFVKGRISSFRQKLITWFKKSFFKDIFVLSSVSSHIRADKDINSSAFRYLSSNYNFEKDFIEEKSWLEYNIKKEDENGIGKLTMPGSGITRALYQTCQNEGIPFVGMITFCSPGYNLMEAKLLGHHVNEVFDLIDNAEKLSLPSVIQNQVGIAKDGYLY